jgi:hypothetical protein
VAGIFGKYVNLAVFRLKLQADVLKRLSFVILCANPLIFIAHTGKSQGAKKGKQLLITRFYAAIITNL